MFHNKYILIRNLATLFIVCNMLSWVFPFPPIFWRVGLVLLALYVIVLEQGKRLFCEKAILFFVAFNLIHFFISFLWIEPSTTQIGNILCALLSLSLFAYLSEKGVMTEKYFSIVGAGLIVVAVLQYFHARTSMLEQRRLDYDANITNGATGLFLFLLPMLFLIKSNLQKWIMLLLCLYFIIAGAKRGNIIAAAIPVLLFVFYALKDARRAPLKRILVLVAIIYASVVAYNWFTTNDFLVYRMEQAKEGNSSGRDEIFAQAWNTWANSDNVGHFLFGYGFDGTLHHIFFNGQGMRVHNDWLEILVDYGLIGVIMYLVIFMSLAKTIRKTKNIQIKMVMLCAGFIWLFKSAYSMGFSEGEMSVLMISLGTAIGCNKTMENEIMK